jgi:hypothetical protein
VNDQKNGEDYLPKILKVTFGWKPAWPEASGNMWIATEELHFAE